jgi:hypothetical protein
MQMAQELIARPLNKIDMSGAFQTFKDANRDFRQANKDIAAARDKIDEARELDKIGQHDRARKEFREGVTTLMARRDQTDVMANAADVADKAGLRDIANSRFQNTWKQFDANVAGLKSTLDTELGKAQLVSAEKRTAMQSQAEIEKYRMLAPGKERQGYDTAMDNALAQFKELVSKNPKLMIDQSAALATLTQLKRQALKEAGYNDEKITQLLGAGSSGVPSVDTSQWGDPKLKQP